MRRKEIFINELTIFVILAVLTWYFIKFIACNSIIIYLYKKDFFERKLKAQIIKLILFYLQIENICNLVYFEIKSF